MHGRLFQYQHSIQGFSVALAFNVIVKTNSFQVGGQQLSPPALFYLELLGFMRDKHCTVISATCKQILVLHSETPT